MSLLSALIAKVFQIVLCRWPEDIERPRAVLDQEQSHSSCVFVPTEHFPWNWLSLLVSLAAGGEHSVPDGDFGVSPRSVMLHL